MSVEQNKAVIRRLFEEVRNKGNFDIIPELISPNFVYRDHKGPEGFRENTIMWRTRFPDLKRTIIDMVGEGDIVAMRDRFHGTLTGKWLGVEPTGRLVDYQLSHFFRFEDGKVVEMLVFANMLEFNKQAGLTPPNS